MAHGIGEAGVGMLTSFLVFKSIARNVNALVKHFHKEKTDTRQQEIKNTQISQIHSKSQSQRSFYLIVNNLAVFYTLKVEQTDEVQRPHLNQLQ